MPLRLFTAFIIVSILWSSCNKRDNADSLGDPIVASVYRTSLHKSELNTVIHPSVNYRDSVALAKAYIDQWVKDQILMEEASKYSIDRSNIDRLVADYRKKLIKFEYENKIVSEQFDTIVSNAELSSFYETNKEQFPLTESIYNVQLAELNNEVSDLKDLYKEWKNDNAEEVFGIASRAISDSTVWLTWKDINKWSDKFSERKATAGSYQQIATENSEIFLKVRESKAPMDHSPLPFVRVRLKQMILHKRKLKLLEMKKEELYKEALEADEIKIMTQ